MTLLDPKTKDDKSKTLAGSHKDLSHKHTNIHDSDPDPDPNPGPSTDSSHGEVCMVTITGVVNESPFQRMTNDEMNEEHPCDGTWLDAMVVVMDSACTIGITGAREIGKARDIRKGAEVNIRTANGVVKASMVGDLHTE